MHEADPGTVGELTAAVPQEGRQRGSVTVTVEAGTWSPAEAGESDDTRELSVMVRDVAVAPAATGDDRTGAGGGAVRSSRAEGDGRLIEAAGIAPRDTAAALAAVLRNPTAHGVRDLSPETALDAEEDAVYLTVTETDLLYYNHGNQPRTVRTPGGTAEIPAHAIVRIEKAP